MFSNTSKSFSIDCNIVCEVRAKSAIMWNLLASRTMILGQLLYYLVHQKLASAWKKNIYLCCLWFQGPPCLLLQTFSSVLLSVIKAVALWVFAGWLVAGVVFFLLFRGPWLGSLELWSVSACRKPKLKQYQFCLVFVRRHPDSSEDSLLICYILTCPKT